MNEGDLERWFDGLPDDEKGKRVRAALAALQNEDMSAWVAAVGSGLPWPYGSDDVEILVRVLAAQMTLAWFEAKLLEIEEEKKVDGPKDEGDKGLDSGGDDGPPPPPPKPKDEPEM